MSTVKGAETNGAVGSSSPLLEEASVQIEETLPDAASNPLLHFLGHLDPNDALEREFVEELARMRREDHDLTIREEDALECSNSSSTPTT